MFRLLRWLMFLLILTVLDLGARAQFFLTGQDAPATQWKQLKTPHFRLIFPEQLSSRAQYTARLLEAAYPEVNNGLKAPSVYTDVVMHNQSSISNALVAWAPRRMDFFHVPAQDGYAQEWISQLVVHELRHVAQLSKLETGFGRGLRFALGQQATGAMAGLFLPNWFLEGDAVWAETILSNTGRGRSPLFSVGLMAQLKQKGIYSYEKAWFGSFRDFTPDIYELGYHLVAYNSLSRGQEIWQKSTAAAAKRPWQIYPLSLSLRQQTGMGVGKLYKSTMDSLSKYWNSDSLRKTTNYTRLSPMRKHYTNYRYPQPTPYGIVAFRTSFDDLSRIVRIDSLGEHVLFTPFYLFPEGFSARNHLVAWNEYQPDLRWSNRSYSVIKIGDIRNGSIRQLTNKSYFFAPDLNHAADRLAVSEVFPDGTSAIVVLDATTGERLAQFNSDAYFLHQPKWLADDEHIAFLATGPQGKSLWLLHLQSMRAEQYSPFVPIDIHLSSALDGKAYLHGAWNGRQEAYVFDFATKQFHVLTSSVFSTADPVPFRGEDNLLFATYDANGWHLAKASKKSLDYKAIQLNLYNTDSLLGFALPADRFVLDKVALPDTTYPVTSYRKGHNLFNVHSWAPFFVDPVAQEIRPGFSVMSQNSLSTMIAIAGFDYNVNEKTGKSVLRMSYLGWFPVIEISVSNGRRKGVARHNDQTYALSWDETAASLMLSVPLNFTRNRWQRGINFASGVDLLHRVMDKDVTINFRQAYTTAFTHGLVAYNLDRLKLRDIFPRYGQIFRLIYRHSSLDKEPGQQTFVSSISYWPGLANHHGIRLYFAAQNESPGYYNFGSYVAVPRGLSGIFGHRMQAFKIDYALPLAYPDLRIGPLVYTKRLRSAVFYDLLATEGKHFASYGVDMLADAHFLRLPAPVSIGFRLSYNNRSQKPVPEFIFGIDWNTIY